MVATQAIQEKKYLMQSQFGGLFGFNVYDQGSAIATVLLGWEDWKPLNGFVLGLASKTFAVLNPDGFRATVTLRPESSVLVIDAEIERVEAGRIRRWRVQGGRWMEQR